MPETEVRPARTRADLLHLLPLALIATLLGVAGLIATVAPSRVETGVYQVYRGEGAAQVDILTVESLDCGWTGDVARCTAPVAGRPFTVQVGYGGSDHRPFMATGCTARHGDRQVACRAGLGDYGHGSATVWLHDELDLTGSELAQLEDAAPWWRDANVLGILLLALCLALAAAAGIATYLVGPRTRPLPVAWRFPLAVGVGVLGLALFGVTGTLLVPDRAPSPWSYLLGPLTLPFAFALMALQWRLAGGGSRRGPDRWAGVVMAVVMTGLYSFGVSFVVLLQSGFID